MVWRALYSQRLILRARLHCGEGSRRRRSDSYLRSEAPIAVARRLRNGDKTIIRVVTTRHRSFAELRNSGRSVDYPYAMLELVPDKEGKGTGPAIGAAKIRFDKKKNRYEVESFGQGANYNRLLNVRTME
jgi:hypothetical protein